MNKKGFEIAINFIVILIITLVVFGMGLYFAKQIFFKAKQITAQLDQNSEDRINLLLDRGEQVAFPITSKDISGNEIAVFGLGVLNVLDSGTMFTVEIKCSKYVNRAGAEVILGGSKTYCDLEGNQKWSFPIDPFSLGKNDKKVIPIAIVPPSGKPAGTYAFQVTVNANGKLYGDAPKQIYVNLS